MNQAPDLFNFLVQDAGGEDAVYSKFYAQKIADLASEGKTLDEVLALGEDDGWGEWLRGMELADLVKIINPSAAIPAAPSKKRTRMSKADKAVLHDQIVVFVKANDKCSASDIAASVGIETRSLGLHCKQLRENGLISATGERAQTRYSAPKAAPTPPVSGKRKK